MKKSLLPRVKPIVIIFNGAKKNLYAIRQYRIVFSTLLLLWLMAGATLNCRAQTPTAIIGTAEYSDSSIPSSTGTAHIGDNVNFTFTTSETVQTPVVTIDGQNATVVPFGSANSYLAEYTFKAGDPNGSVSIVVNLADLAGNTSQTTSTASFTFNSTPVIIATGTLSALSTNTGTASATTQFSVSAVNIGGSTGTSITVTAPQGFEVSTFGLFTNSLNFFPPLEPQTVLVRLAASAAGGTYSGDVILSASGATSVHVPTAVSTVSTDIISISLNNANPSLSSLVTFQVKFSGPVSGVNTGNFSLSGTATSGASVSSVIGSGNSYQVQALTGPGAGTLVLNMINTTGMSSGINSLPYSSAAYNMDRILPTASISTAEYSNGSPPSSTGVAHIGDMVAVSFTTSKTVLAPVVTVGGQSATVTNFGTADSYLVQYTFKAGDPNGSVPIVVNLTDAVGNTTQTTSIPSFTFSSTPAIIATGALSALSTNTGTASVPTQFSISTFNIATSTGTSPVTVTAPSGFEVSTSASGPFSNSIIFYPNSFAPQTVYVRLSASDGGGVYSGDVVLSASGAASVHVPTAASNVATLITSITARGGGVSNSSSVTFDVTFKDNVSGVSAGNFSVISSGVNGPAISFLNGSGNRYSIDVNTDTGNGTITLYLANVSGISPAVGNTIPFTGDSYTINKTSPVVSTLAAANVTTTSATLGNNITDLGNGSGIIDQGAVYSATNTSPTLSDTKLSFGTNKFSTGVYSGIAGGLSPNTTYYVVAYATNAIGTSYGNPVSFTTASANLSGIGLSAGTLNPGFSATTTGYTASVGSGVSSITVTPTASYSNAVITVNGFALTAGSASVNLNGGPNTITILVTADGATTDSYTLTVNRAFTPPGNALAFDGVDDGVIMGPPPAAVSGSFTVEAWVMPADGTKEMHVFSTRSAGEMSFDMQIMSGNRIHGDIGSGSAWLTTAADATFNYQAGQWIHIAYVVTPSGYSIYANGNLVGSGPLSGTALLMDNTHTTTIGCYPGESTYFNGSIDEVRVYNAALSQANIQADMLSTASSVPLNLVNYYDFDNGAAGGTNIGTNTLTDRTTTGYNGTLSNFALSGTTSNWVESYAMVVPTATAPTGIGSTGFTANWTAPTTGTVTNYLVDVSASPTFTPVISGSPFSTASTSIPISSLTEGKPYYYRVRADKTSVTGEGDYSAVITAVPVSHDAGLAGLSTSPGTLSPVFVTGTNAYTDTVSNNVTTVLITAVPNDPLATITMLTNGNRLSNGATANVPIILGNNIIVITVTAQDGVTQSTYNLSLLRQAGLPALTTSAVSNISSNAALTGYQVTSNGGATITDQGIVYSATNANPTTADTKVAFGSKAGTFVHFASGFRPGATYYVRAYATNSTGTAYGNQVSFTTPNALTDLVLSSGTLSPVFAPGTTNYTATVSNAADSVTVTPTVNDATATATVNGTAVTSGAASANIALNVGQNTITTIVTAGDGITTETYTVTVTRARSSNAALSNLALSSGTLSPVFAAGTTGYTATVSNGTGSTTVTPTVADGTATVTVNGVAVTSGSASASLVLNLGDNVIPIVVTAGDGTTTQTYTLTVTRPALPVISYNGTHIYGISTAITTLTPTGSNVAAPAYGPVTTLGTQMNMQIVKAVADSAGNVYAVCNFVQSIQEFPVDGGPAISLGFPLNNPTGIAIDRAGNLYVTEQYGNLYRIAAGSNVSTVLASNLSDATGVAVDSKGYIYVTGGINSIVLKYPPGGAGAPVQIGAGSSPPRDVAVDNLGNLYTVDYNNNVNVIPADGSPVKSIATVPGPFTIDFNPSGYLSTIDGYGHVIKMNVDGSNQQTILSGVSDPMGLGTDGRGDIYLGTIQGTFLRVSHPTGGYYIDKHLPAGLTFNTNTGAISGTPTELSPATNYRVTAYNGGGSTSATVSIKVGSSNAALSNLALSSGTLSPVFAPGTTGYTATVSNATGSITVTPTAADADATIKVNGVAVASGSASASQALNLGDNIIPIVITAGDGTTTQTYTLTVTRPALPVISYNGAHIYDISTAITTLTPTSSNVAAPAYGPVTTLGTQMNIQIVKAIADSAGNVYAVCNGFGSIQEFPANGGPAISLGGPFNFPSGIAIDRAGNLYVTEQYGNLYRIAAGSNVSTVLASNLSDATGVAVDSKGYIYITGGINSIVLKYPPGGAGAPVQIGAGSSPPRDVAVDNLGNLYTVDYNNNVNVIPADGSPVKSIATVAGAYTIDFNPSGYLSTVDAFGHVIKMNVDGSNQQTILSGVSDPMGLGTDGRGDIYLGTIQGTFLRISHPTGGYFIDKSLPAGLTFDTNTGAISGTPTELSPATNYRVTAYNAGGSTSATVSIKVASSNDKLTNLVLSGGTFSPVFATGTTGYTATVSNATSSITVTPTTADSTATVKVNGTAVTSGRPSAPIILGVGPGTILIAVTAQDGVTTQTYTVSLTRLSNNANLAGLTINSGILSPAFATSKTAYADTVSNATSSITLTPTTSDVNATVMVNGITVSSGSASASVPLVVGTNAVYAVVHAQDGTRRTYTVTITRLSNNANLSNLAIGSGTLGPAFAFSTTSYSAAVSGAASSINVTPTAVDPNATIKVNGISTPSGSPVSVALSKGVNSIHAVVLAQDGTQRTYTITISHLSNNANLANLTISNGPMSPAFTSPITGYLDTVSNATTSVTLTATTSDVNATVMVNGITVSSGSASASVPLKVGPNAVYTVVYAQDGTRRTYMVTVTRLSNIANLANLTVSSGTLSPAFVFSTTGYTDTVSNSTTSVQVTPTTSEAHATVKVNGISVTPGAASQSLPLAVGNNTIYAAVLAQDGTRRTYTVTVRRLTTGGLSSLYLPGNGEQAPLISSLNEKVEAGNILSPNGDGVNDIWVVKNIAFYPNNTVSVYDRSGKVVFTKKGYTNDWAGTYRGSVLSEGTYYYLVDLGNGSTVEGFITVVRDK